MREGERRPRYGDWRKFEGEEGGEGLGNEEAIFRWSEQVRRILCFVGL